MTQLWKLPRTQNQLEEDADNGKVIRLFDSVFKFIFCKEERMLVFLDLVNAIVFPNNERQFKKAQFIDREKSSERFGGKSGRFDSLAVLDDGDIVNLEMQASLDQDFGKRSVVYTSWIHGGQLDRGKKYHEVARTISINILGYDRFESDKNFRRSFSFRDDEIGEQLNDDMRIIFLEIPRFMRIVQKPRNKLERWMTYFAGTGGSEMEQIAQQEPRISDALAAERFFSMDKEKRYAYFLEWKQIIDEESREAIAEARGKAKSKFQIAKNMLDDGASVEFAVRYTGLSLEEVQNLQNKTVPRV